MTVAVKDLRHLHLRGALGVARTELWNGREHLVVPVVALQEAVIHAVNAKTAEYVPAAPLTASASKWNGHPLVVGHPTKDGKQISAHDPVVLDRYAFGFIRGASMTGTRLAMEAMVDPERLVTLKQDQLLADLRAGKAIEVSVGAFVHTRDAKGEFGGRAYDGEWTEITPDHLAFLPNGKGACSIEMGCGAHRAAMLVTAEGLEDVKMEEKMSVKNLKARILALFDTPEQAASEEAAELIAYNAMRTQLDAVNDQWKAASALVDDLISDEEENPTESRAEEEAEEEVEGARLDAVRMHCYTMISALQSICNTCSDQQMPDISPSDPRYMEEFKALVGKSISAKNMKTIQATHDASHEMHNSTVALGAQCNGMKLLSENELTIRAACRCEEDGMTKADRIAALLKHEHNAVKDLTEKTSDDVLTVLEAQAETNKKNAEAHAAQLKAAQDKADAAEVALKAAQAAQIPAEELTSLRALAEDKKQQDATAKAALVEQLIPLKTLTKEQLEAKSLDDLKTLAAFAKMPAVDYSIKGVPAARAAEGARDFTPPDPYKAIQPKTV